MRALIPAMMRALTGCPELVHNNAMMGALGLVSGGAMANRLEDFQKLRADLNEEILGCGHLGMKRFFALDHQAYEPGALGTKNKELLGLVASAVLRCDDCITYHLVRCGEEGWKRDEVIDALNVALIVGGSITIPHVRRAFARMREINGLKP
jgi:AhpD family alkylhydroperoxidase